MDRSTRLGMLKAEVPFSFSREAYSPPTAEDQFIVQDEETEERYNFKLVEAVERAKENKGKLFAGIQFYVTPKVPVDTKLLRNVVTANGGQVRMLPLTL